MGGSIGGRRPGFSLVEVMVTMVLLGLLAGWVAQAYREHMGLSREDIARHDMEFLARQIRIQEMRSGNSVGDLTDRILGAAGRRTDRAGETGTVRAAGERSSSVAPRDRWARGLEP